MTISTQAIANALESYDKQTGWFGYYVTSSTVGEDKDIAALRKFYNELPNITLHGDLVLEELFALIKIIVAAKPTNHKLHDEVFSNLISTIGKEKYEALAKLCRKGQLTTEHYDFVTKHTNPLNAAKTINHFCKYKSGLYEVKYGKTLAEKPLKSFLSLPDPLQAIKLITSEIAARTMLAQTKINTLENQKAIGYKPIESAYILKKLILNKVLVEEKLFTGCLQHKNLKSMVDAVILITEKQNIIKNETLKSEMLNEALLYDHPHELIKGALILQNMKDPDDRKNKTFNTAENRAKLRQSGNPVAMANVIDLDQTIALVNSSNAAYAVVRVIGLFTTNKNPIDFLKDKKTKLEEQIKKGLTQ